MIKKRFALVLAVMMLFSITMNFSVSAGSEIEIEACSSAYNDDAHLHSCASRSCTIITITETVRCPTHCRCNRTVTFQLCTTCVIVLAVTETHTNPSMGHSMFSPAAGVWICRNCGYGG
ncbi:MAG: hypothetical protein LBC73_05615 [Oscillospiraceae bacterium]|jgi:hypothetical protein|nr:hypothetical protein [Oscillospiraceae bacterium]